MSFNESNTVEQMILDATVLYVLEQKNYNRIHQASNGCITTKI